MPGAPRPAPALPLPAPRQPLTASPLRLPAPPLPLTTLPLPLTTLRPSRVTRGSPRLAASRSKGFISMCPKYRDTWIARTPVIERTPTK